MAITVETGSGLSGADAYVSVAFVDAYHVARGNSALWDGFDTAAKETFVVRATDYIDKRFGRRFRGWKKSRAQALEWPRNSAFDDDEYALSAEDDVPRNLEKACAEYALRAALVGVLIPDPIHSVPAQDLTPGAAARDPVPSGEVSRKVEKIGPLEEETWYRTSAGRRDSVTARTIQSSLVNDPVIPEYPEADLWLEELIISQASRSLGRA